MLHSSMPPLPNHPRYLDFVNRKSGSTGASPILDANTVVERWEIDAPREPKPFFKYHAASRNNRSPVLYDFSPPCFGEVTPMDLLTVIRLCVTHRDIG